MSNWVMIAPSCSRRWIGMTSSSGSRHRMTPAACTPHWRLSPSRPAGRLHDALDLGVGLVERAELPRLGVAGVGRVEDAGQRDALAHHVRRHRLGDPVADGVGHAEHPGGVLHRLLGLDGAVGDDLGDPLLAVGLGGVADHVAAPALVEVEVDVGHRDALGVEEPLEQQLVLDRVELGDAHRVGDQRAGGRPTARADPDAVALGVLHQVGGDQEVAREAHLAHHADLVLGLLAVRLGDAVREAGVQAALDLLDQPGVLALALGHGEPGHQVRALVELHVHPLGDRQGVVAGLREVPPEVAHLGGALEVEVLGVELEPVRVGHRLAGLHAQQHLVRGGVGGVGVVQVVGGEERAAASCLARRSRSSRVCFSMPMPWSISSQ